MDVIVKILGRNKWYSRGHFKKRLIGLFIKIQGIHKRKSSSLGYGTVSRSVEKVVWEELGGITSIL